MPRKNEHAVALGRRGGRVSSPAKAAAARKNAQKAGRRPKFAVGDRVRANDLAPGDYRDRIGRITEIGPGRAEYGVAFTSEPRTGHLMSWWLDRVE
jgi:hypothetical protein